MFFILMAVKAFASTPTVTLVLGRLILVLQLRWQLQTVDGYSVSVNNDGSARYHLTNQAGTEWVFGQKASDNDNFIISKEVSGTETDYITLYEAGRIEISATGAGQDLYLRSADHIFIEAGQEEDGAIFFRSNSGIDSYRFAKSGQTDITGNLSMGEPYG